MSAGRPKIETTYPRVVACSGCGYDHKVQRPEQSHKCRHCKSSDTRRAEMLRRRAAGHPMQRDPMYFEPPRKCRECPSRTVHGRCGRITSGDQQWLPAQVVRLRGECPRGVYADVGRVPYLIHKISRLARSGLAL